MDKEFMEKKLLDSLDGFKGSKKETDCLKNLFLDPLINFKVQK